MKDSVGKRILIIVQNLPVPFDRRVWLEATTLRAHGYKVSVISPKPDGAKWCDVIEGISVFRYKAPTNTKGVLGYFFEFAYCWLMTFCLTLVVALRKGFDVIQACNPPDTYFLIGVLYKLFGKKFVFDHHDLAPEMYAAKYDRSNTLLAKGLLLLEKLTFSTADIVITTNESHKEIAVNRGGIGEEKIFIVRSGPDFGRLRITAPESGLKAGKKYLVTYLGEMCPQDGVDYLLRAIKLIRDELAFSDAHFVIMGGGPALEDLRRYGSELGLEGAVEFTGRVSDEDLCRYLSTADLCVDPDPLNEWSDKSTMNKILEYMAFAKPIVAFDLKEHRRSAGDAAVYARPNEERDFAGRMLYLLRHKSLREKMGSIGRARIERELSWDHTKLNLLRAYTHLCAGDDRTMVKELRCEYTV